MTVEILVIGHWSLVIGQKILDFGFSFFPFPLSPKRNKLRHYIPPHFPHLPHLPYLLHVPLPHLPPEDVGEL
ncbi:MAG: hypothetical protein QNJ46_25225 [Leptolyngbyaceae cyanobacterium MO_188.B28]|nr:hypothetical protein [Leptolyngbyaceae cyanobacterium MO_188.B28]